MYIPHSDTLPIGPLAGIFSNTTATYKFYWFMAIVEAVEHGQVEIRKQHLFARMVAQAWYTVNYFHISFGKLDALHRVTDELRVRESLHVDARKESIIEHLDNRASTDTQKLLASFDRNVPHRFLTPWFPQMGDKMQDIYERSQRFENQCLYALHKDYIVVNPAWVDYIRQHGGILKHFTLWHLAQFVQVRNPSVPNIIDKLTKPAARSGLTKQNRFWTGVLAEVGGIDCIYTGKKLYADSKYAVEHFIPHAFVSHDLIWNLIPADPSFNSKKSDKLPPLNKYFDGFYQLQETAVEIMRHKQPNNPFLEEYLPLFPTLNLSKQKYYDVLSPLITIAHNNGFSFLED